MKQRILSILVDNTAGVLSRVSGLFSRRSYNIDSLTVGVTADPRYSRMTVVCSGDDTVLDQITKQLNKLVDVRDIKILEPDTSVSRELILVKVRASKATRQNVTSIADIFRAKVIDVSVDSMVLELTGSKSKLEAFITLLSDGNEILEIARTGVTGLSRGSDYVLFL
ncbi:MAG: acetolactate synthase small subunit [Clostridiales bacterium]|nr:acetolactate synthase small subunit [Clostridiales bacterium]